MNTITAYAKEMSDFLSESEPTERRAFIKSFVKEIVVMPGSALLRYTIPIDPTIVSFIHGRNVPNVGIEVYAMGYSACINSWCSNVRHVEILINRTSMERLPPASATLDRSQLTQDWMKSQVSFSLISYLEQVHC